MSIISHLKADHKTIRELLKKIEHATAQTHSKILVDLGRELTIHASLEEELIYPLLEKTKLKKGIRHAYEEHHLINVQFDELLELKPTDEVIKDKSHVLAEIVNHHLEEEEEDVFPVMEANLSDERFAELDQAYPAHKRILEDDFANNPPTSSQQWSKRRAMKANK